MSRRMIDSASEFDSLRGLAEQLRHHLARHAGRPFAIDERQHAAPVRARLRRIRAGASVGEHEAVEQLRRRLIERQRRIAAHRTAADRPRASRRALRAGRRHQRRNRRSTARSTESSSVLPPKPRRSGVISRQPWGMLRICGSHRFAPIGNACSRTSTRSAAVTRRRVEIRDRPGADVAVLACHRESAAAALYCLPPPVTVRSRSRRRMS